MNPTYQPNKPQRKTIVCGISSIKNCNERKKKLLHISVVILSKLKSIFYRLINMYLLYLIETFDYDGIKNFGVNLFDDKFHELCLREFIKYFVTSHNFMKLNTNYTQEKQVEEFFECLKQFIKFDEITINEVNNLSQQDLIIISQIIRRSIEYDKVLIKNQIIHHFTYTTKDYIGRFLKSYFIRINIYSNKHKKMLGPLMKKSIEKFLRYFYSEVNDEMDIDVDEIKNSENQNSETVDRNKKNSELIQEFIQDAKNEFINLIGKNDMLYDELSDMINNQNQFIDKNNPGDIILYTVIILYNILDYIERTNNKLKDADYLINSSTKVKSIKLFTIIPIGNFSSSYITLDKRSLLMLNGRKTSYSSNVTMDDSMEKKRFGMNIYSTLNKNYKISSIKTNSVEVHIYLEKSSSKENKDISKNKSNKNKSKKRKMQKEEEIVDSNKFQITNQRKIKNKSKKINEQTESNETKTYLPDNGLTYIDRINDLQYKEQFMELGADPGKKNLVTISINKNNNEFGNNKKKYMAFNLTSKEYYHNGGIYKLRNLMEKKKKSNNINDLELKIQTPKTKNPYIFLDHITSFLEVMNEIITFYSTRTLLRLKFQCYSRKKRTIDNFINGVIYNSSNEYEVKLPNKTYLNSIRKKKIRNKNKKVRKNKINSISLKRIKECRRRNKNWIDILSCYTNQPKQSLSFNKKPLLFYGNATINSIKNNLTIPSNSLLNKFVQKINVISTSEMYTSKICCNCKKKKLKPLIIREEQNKKIDGIQQCGECGETISRDINSSINILNIGKYYLTNNEYPPEFKKENN